VLAGLSVASLAVGAVLSAPAAYAGNEPPQPLTNGGPPPPNGGPHPCFTHKLTVEGGTATAVVSRLKPKPHDSASANESASTLTRDTFCKDLDVLLVSYSKTSADFSLPQWAYDHATGTVTKKDHELTLTIKVPPCFSQVDLVVGTVKDLINPLIDKKKLYDGRILGSRDGLGSISIGKPGFWVGGDKACAPPTVTGTSDCKKLTVTVANPADGIPVTVIFKGPDGNKPPVDLDRGKSASFELPGSTGLTVIVTIGVTGSKHTTDTKIDYSKPKTGCEESAGLPVTGANAGLAAGVAAGLIGVGGGLFWAARRRRVMFSS